MHFVGIDLAWGERKPTGIAVLDDRGRLLRVAAVRTDAEIVAELEPYVNGGCLVGIDAPLVVPNATGNRPAEAALNRDFARFQAGAHPSNTGKPEFSGTPRGARLSALLGLDMNPRSRRKRRAIEVYPHPAIVALFRLGRTLKYKNKPGRPVEELRSELLVLMGLLGGLERAEPPLILDAGWSELLTAVEGATRKSELRVAEDQVDAVVCAYVALFAVRRPELTTTYGDFATGYIVTPTLPPDLRPEARSLAPVADPISAAVQAYADLRSELIATGERLVDQVTAMLDDAGINYLTVSGRTKSVASFADKAARLADGQAVFPDPLRDIGDQIGVRVITYVQRDVATVADILHDQLVVHDDRDRGRETARLGQFGYASRHLQVSTPSPPSGSDGEPIAGRIAQIQIRTVLQHAWAEFEHDIRYKGDDSRGTRQRLRPQVHSCGRSARTRRSRVLDDPGPVAHRSPGLDRRRSPSARRRPQAQPPRAGRVPGRPVRRRRVVADRALRLDLRPAAGARHHVAGRTGRHPARPRRGIDHGADGLPLSAGGGTAPR